jgi:hypothetical protein
MLVPIIYTAKNVRLIDALTVDDSILRYENQEMYSVTFAMDCMKERINNV